MAILIDYVATYAPWLYAVCGLVALFQIYRLWNVRNERRQAVFSLEREKAIHELQSIFSTALLLLLIMGGTYFTSTTLRDAVASQIAEARAPNPTPAIIPTPTNTPLPATETPTVTPTSPPDLATSAAEATPEFEQPLEAPQPTDTPAPEPVVQAASCPDPRAVIAAPGNGQVVSGIVSVAGTASHEQFQYYKIEYASAGSESFNYLNGGNSPVINGVLITFDSTVLGNGGWTLRLIVVDNTGNFPPPCQVTVQIQN
ncbi:MAG: hypothetical protein DCC55_36280 [Chloroflexi bacterium]|nr:MAG: hypothetical protein DCC55_36280 [Chloroflexota bacterium]